MRNLESSVLEYTNMRIQPAKIENVEQNKNLSLVDLSIDTTQSLAQEADQGLQKLSNVARTQPEMMHKSIMQLEQLIADTNDDPQLQGRAFLNLARCFLGVAANKAAWDPEGARIVLYGTPSGRNTQDHHGKSRGYDGAVDALKEASKRLPRDTNIKAAELMTTTLARQLQR